MKTIYKYILEVTDVQEVEIPVGAILLDVQVQKYGVVFWAIVDTDAELVKREVYIHGTGHKVAEEVDNGNAHYLGTFQLHNGDLVFHVFVNKVGKIK